MSVTTPYVAVDWGTTRMRAYLCAADGELLGRIEGPGIGQLTDLPEPTLLGLIGDWIEQHGAMDLLLGGMAGSNIGWREAPYLACPVQPSDLADRLLEFEHNGHRVRIVPGISCINSLGQPDVMRGEEIQVLGWAAERRNEQSGLICLPGTHTKWIHVRDGRIESFTTSITGELFALLQDHSVLFVNGDQAKRKLDDSAFMEGIGVATSQGGNVLHLAFSTRSRALLEPERFGDPASFLSGVLVGADVRSSLENFETAAQEVQLIGSSGLCERYAMALTNMGVESRMLCGDDMVLNGFKRIVELMK